MAHSKEAKKALDPSWQPIAVGSPESSGKQWKDPARRGIVRKSLESGTAEASTHRPRLYVSVPPAALAPPPSFLYSSFSKLNLLTLPRVNFLYTIFPSSFPCLL